jgi:hypothetical protein
VDVRTIIEMIFASPSTTHDSVPKIVVNTDKIAATVSSLPETVETLLFQTMLSHRQYLRAVNGKVPCGFTVREVAQRPQSSTGAEGGKLPLVDQPKGLKGVTSVLHQLGVSDDVLELCRFNRTVPDIVSAANQLQMSLDDLLFRLRELDSTKLVRLQWHREGYCIQVASAGGATLARPPIQAVRLIANEMYAKNNMRVKKRVAELADLFYVLQEPSHGRIAEVNGHASDSSSPVRWAPPRPTITAAVAVDIIAEFVRENRTKLQQGSFEAACVLAGVSVGGSRSASVYGAAGLQPLVGSWHQHSPRFGSLQMFDFDWVMAALKPHNLDQPSKGDER